MNIWPQNYNDTSLTFREQKHNQFVEDKKYAELMSIACKLAYWRNDSPEFEEANLHFNKLRKEFNSQS